MPIHPRLAAAKKKVSVLNKEKTKTEKIAARAQTTAGRVRSKLAVANEKLQKTEARYGGAVAR
jgi:hypothetical protein